MYPIWIRDGKNPQPETPIYYVLAQNGFYIRKKTKFWDAIVPVDKISILEDETPSIKLFLPQIPSEITKSAVRFAAWVYREHKTEAVMLLWFAEKYEKYQITVSKQTVSPGYARYDIPRHPPEYLLIGTIHSHGSMEAFHSSVDEDDEEYFDGLHATLGKLDIEKSQFEVSIQAVVNGKRFPLQPPEWLGGIVPHKEIIDTWSWRGPRIKTFYALEHGEAILTEGYNPPEEWQKNIIPLGSLNYLGGEGSPQK